MKTVPVDKKGLQEAIKILQQGGVLAYPADTCFGLTAMMNHPEALQKIIDIKGRSGLKSMSVMLGSFEELAGYVMLDDFAESVVKKLLPGAYTLVLPKGPKVPSFYFAETPTLGIRIPNHALSLELIEKTGGPLITTSANRAGEPLTFTSDEVVKVFEESKTQPDLVLEGEVLNKGGASTVIEIQNGKILLLREGMITKEELKKRLEGIEIGL